MLSHTRFNRVSLMAVCLLAGLTSMTAAQGANQWQQLAPLEGGAVLALLSEGERVYAGMAPSLVNLDQLTCVCRAASQGAVKWT